MSAIDLAVIAGDGIGPEVVAEGLKVLDAVTVKDRPISTAASFELVDGQRGLRRKA